jgi:hypothetical protein
MAFVQRDSWDAQRHFGGPAGPLGAALGAWALPLRRAGACCFTAVVHFGLLYMLIARLSDGTAVEQRPAIASIALYDLADPGVPAPSPPASARPASAPAATTVVDLSEPADLPPPEWSMSTMRVARLSEPQASPSGALSASAGGGKGSGPRLSEFVGFGDGIGGQLLLDQPMLEAARLAALGAVPGAQGTALIFLRVAPTGIVTEAVIRGGSREMASALRRELLGKKLFLVRTRIRESALVALPPLDLSASS